MHIGLLSARVDTYARGVCCLFVGIKWPRVELVRSYNLSLQIDHNGVVKLCDFGLARVMGREPSNSSENSRAGTPVYLAPEALQGAPTTNKVDVYR